MISLSKRLGHKTPQVTMTTYAAEIEKRTITPLGRARVNALFGQTTMAARMAASDRDRLRQAMIAADGEVISLADVRDPAEDPVIRPALIIK